MARLLYTGMEWATFLPVGTNPTPDGNISLGAVVTATSPVHGGSRSARCNSGAGNAQSAWQSEGYNVAVSTTYYTRMYCCFDALPGSTVTILQYNGITTAPSVRLTSGGKLQFWNDTTNTQIGSDSVETIVADGVTFYRIEFSTIVNASTQVSGGELRLNGETIASTTGLTLAFSNFVSLQAGWVSAAPGANKSVYLDDYALNDSTGTNENSWPGPAKIQLLLPISDNAVGTGWTLGTGTATGGNAFESVNNTPPTGVADLAAGSDPKQVRNAAAAANSNLDFNVTSYSTAKVSTAVLKCIQELNCTATPSATSPKTGNQQIVSNPAGAADSFGFRGSANGGTYPTGWVWNKGTIRYKDSVTIGTSPVLRLQQVTSSTRIAVCCAAGIYVEYADLALPFDQRRVVRNSLLRR